MKFYTPQLIFFITLSFNALGQSNRHFAEDSKIYFEQKKETVYIEDSDDRLIVNHDISQRKRYKESVTPNNSNEYIYTYSFEEVSAIKATYGDYKSNGNYSTKRCKEVTLKTDLVGSSFYDDNSFYEIVYPNVQPNSYTALSYSLEVKEPEFLNRFFFDDYYPVENSEYQIIVNSEIEIGWKLFGDNKNLVKYTSSTENKLTTHKWTLEKAPEIHRDGGDNGYLHHATHIVAHIKKDAKKKPLLGNYQDLMNLYASFLSKINASDDSEIETITQAVITGKNTDREKAEAIFNWVQDNIRYIAIEDGWRGFVPYPAENICQKRYGDCKDMSHLLVTMLKIAGLDAKHAWVGTRRLPYTYDETPTPAVDNHLVVLLELNDEKIILDATNSYSTFGYPTDFILGKQVLFKNNAGKAETYKIPEYSAEDCRVLDTIYCRIQGSDLVGKNKKYFETFQNSSFRNKFARSDNRDQYLRNFLEIGQNNYNYSNVQITDTLARSFTQIHYDFSIPGYVKSFDNERFVNLNLNKYLYASNFEKDRKNEYSIDYKRVYGTYLEFEVDSTMEIVAIPKDFSKEYSFGKVHCNYQNSSQLISYSFLLHIDALTIEPAQFDEWNTFIKDLQKIYNASIELKK